jgi:hypothetical protein
MGFTTGQFTSTVQCSGKWHSVMSYVQSNRHIRGISTIRSPGYKQNLAHDGCSYKCSYEFKRIVLWYYIKQSVRLYKCVDVKIKEDSGFMNWIYFLIAVSFLFQKNFIQQIHAKYSFGHLNPCRVFPLSLWFANKGTKSFIDTGLNMFCEPSLVLNQTVNILELGRINTLMRANSQFHCRIKFHCRFQRHDQQQGTSVIENTMLINDRSVNDFQIQWQGCKPERGEYSKY